MLTSTVLKSQIIAEIPGIDSVSFINNHLPYRVSDYVSYYGCTATFDYTSDKWVIYKICDSKR